MTETRIEEDSLGPIEVPAAALYGASTQRAVCNFAVSDRRIPRELIRALGLVKWAAAVANRDLRIVPSAIADLIIESAEEIVAGAHDAQFVVDVFQTGSGTSTNMNANEVIANRCSQLAGKALGSKVPAHPNDHVNQGQSSNDVFPTAIHLAAAVSLQETLLPQLESLRESLAEKSNAFLEIIKVGRTHLMDATPIRLGQEFSGYSRQVELGCARVQNAIKAVLELPLGGTSVGTGLNCHPDFPRKAIALLADRTGIGFHEAANHFEAQAARDGVVEVSGQLKTVATSLFKIANDIRWLGSGPRCGLGEIRLPATQPGSSIMPGKVNPVMNESLLQVAAQVMGNDATITWGGASGSFELNVMMPVMADNLLQSITLLSNASRNFRERCIDGIEANAQRCRDLVEESLSMVTSLAPIIGYDAAAQIAKRAAETGQTIREVCEAMNVLPAEQLARALDPAGMTEPGSPGAV